MKLKAVSALLLAGAMLASTNLSALSYTGIGNITAYQRDTVGDGLRYSVYDSVDEDGKSQKSYIFEYKPGGGVVPVINYGKKVYGMDRLSSIVKDANENGLHILGAVNGDFYSMQTGVPMGVMIENGELISTDNGNYALGFLADGSAVIGKPEINVSFTNLTKMSAPVKIGQVNKFPTIWGIYMNTESFYSTTLSAAESLEITVKLDGELKAGGTVSGKVIDVKTDALNSEIPEGCAVITVATSYEEHPLLASTEIGDSVKFDITCAAGWSDIITAVGGGDLILDGGVMPEGIIDESHEKVSNPRTAVGIKPDGRLIFFATEGRSGNARGLKLEELSALMAELGCVTALNLDGGGSTTVMVKPPLEGEISYASRPIDTNYRALANGILFSSIYTPDGVPGALAPAPDAKYLLRGSTVGFEARLLDRAYMPIEGTLSGDSLTAQFAESYPEGSGSFSGGKFTAGQIGGEYFIKISSAADSTVYGETTVIVADTLDSLETKKSRIKMLPGTRAKIDVIAEYNGNTVLADAASFYYTLNGTHTVPNPEDYPTAAIVCDLGYLEPDGTFQAFGGVAGEVELGVWFDQFVRYVKIEINNEDDVIANFESPEDTGRFTVSENAVISTAPGYKSDGSIVISPVEAETASIAAVKPTEPAPIFSDAKSIIINLAGEYSGIPTVTLSDEDKNEYVLSYSVTKDYSKQLGWRELTAEIPESLRTGDMTVTTILGVTIPENGAIAMDNPTVHYGKITPSPISGIENHWAEESINTLYDMTVIEDSDCITEGEIRTYPVDVPLARGEFTKLLVRYLGIDTSPYLVDGAVLEADTPTDKVPYIRAAIGNGLMGGRGTLEDGSVIFDASATITREEAFKVFGTILESPETEVTFADSADISSWAMVGISKCVSAGLIKGYEDNTLRPRATISRAEMASLLMRMG